MLNLVHHDAPSGLPGWNETISIFADRMRRVKSITTSGVTGPGGNWVTGEYSYDGAGNITKIGADVYHYDKLSRLTQAVIGGIAQAYVYDLYGNMVKYCRGTAMTPCDATTTGPDVTVLEVAPPPLNTPNAQVSNHLKSSPDYPVIYNPIGAITTLRHPRQLTSMPYTYSWDPLGTMRWAKGPALGKVFIYDAKEERIGVLDYKTSASSVMETWSLRDMGNQVLRDFVYSSTGSAGTWSIKEDYIRRGGSLLSTVSSGAVKHYALDHLGTPRLVTDDTGKRLTDHTYFPFGEEITVGADKERMKFTGHERDDNDPAGGSQIGDLDYMHARYYGPMIGRFLSVDPLNASAAASYPQTWNRYGYVRNNPINAKDPDGRQESNWREDHNMGTIFVEGLLDMLPTADNPIVIDPYGSPLETVANLFMIATILTPFPGDDAAGVSATAVTRDMEFVPRPTPVPRLAPAPRPTSAPRPRPAQARAAWASEHPGQKYPQTNGRNWDADHIKPLAEGGAPLDGKNIRPMPHWEHVDWHMLVGDFVRWAKRR